MDVSFCYAERLMERQPEPELMLGEEQARAYAEADFEEAHSRFVELLKETFSEEALGTWVLDLGCGPADISLRVARAYPACFVDGIDGSQAMLSHGLEAVRREGLEHRIRLTHGYLPGAALPRDSYDAVVSNSLLHHLKDARVLWETAAEVTRPGAPIFVMDLMRPSTIAVAEEMVELYCPNEPEHLKRDFFLSLRAAYRLDEVREQLGQAGLSSLKVDVVSDRHLLVHGRRDSTGSSGGDC